MFWEGKNMEHEEQGWCLCEQGIEGKGLSSLPFHLTLTPGVRAILLCFNTPIRKLTTRLSLTTLVTGN